jgi:SAM-dependent methyltransferase
MTAADTQAPRPSGWDHPETPRYYEAFCEKHDRYRWANKLLAAQARLMPGLNVLDLGAGTGRTAEAALEAVPFGLELLCVEPAAAMRSAGERRLSGKPVRWTSSWPDPRSRFDRILAGACIWQMLPLDETVGRLSGLLAPGGRLCFNVPSLYVGIPDKPGGGADPLLLGLPALLAAAVGWASAGEAPIRPLPDPGEIDRFLRSCRLIPERRHAEFRFTQAAYRDWLKIPPLTDRLLGGLEPADRARRIDEAYARVDPDSWKAEGWFFWFCDRDPGPFPCYTVALSAADSAGRDEGSG